MKSVLEKLILLIFSIPFQSSYASTILGSYQFKDEFDKDMTLTQKTNQWLGHIVGVVPFYSEWCPASADWLNWYTTTIIPDHLNAIWSSGSVPLFTWQPVCYDPQLPTLSKLASNIKSQDTFIKDIASKGNSIGSGIYDDYITSVASQLKKFLAGPDGVYGTNDDRRMYIRLGHEMNGNSKQWSVGFNKYITSTDYINMWIRTRIIFEKELNRNLNTPINHRTRIQWIWSPSNTDMSYIPAESFYPGDMYVDWIGFDVYNLGGVNSGAKDSLLPMLHRLQTLAPSKPIAITEFGCDYVASKGVSAKAAWLSDFMNTVLNNNIQLIVQYNVGLSAVYGSTQVPDINDYATQVRTSANSLIFSDGTNKRILSDSAFTGSVTTNTLIPSDLPFTTSVAPKGHQTVNPDIYFPSTTLIGSYQFQSEFDMNMTLTLQTGQWLNKAKLSVVPFFTQWCPAIVSWLDWYTKVEIIGHLKTIWDSGSVPLFTWQPACYDPEIPTLSKLDKSIKTPDTFIKDIASDGIPIGDGIYDNYIISVATVLKTFLSGPDGTYGTNDDRRVYIRLGHEMNGAWYQWNVAYNKYITTEDYRLMWIRVHTIFNNILNQDNSYTDIDHSIRIQWIWNPNNFDTGGVAAEDYYPGDTYVDWLAMDVYNPGGGSYNASNLMLPMIARFKALSPNKPIAIPEFGCDYIASLGIQRKVIWLRDFMTTAQQYGIGMLVQFNFEVNAVYGDKHVPNINEYPSIVKVNIHNPVYSDPNNNRLISDIAFKGVQRVQVNPNTATTTTATTTASPSISSTFTPVSTTAPIHTPIIKSTSIPTLISTNTPSTLLPSIHVRSNSIPTDSSSTGSSSSSISTESPTNEIQIVTTTTTSTNSNNNDNANNPPSTGYKNSGHTVNTKKMPTYRPTYEPLDKSTKSNGIHKKKNLKPTMKPSTVPTKKKNNHTRPR